MSHKPNIFMRRITVLLIILLPGLLNAQSNKQRIPRDSGEYYQYEMGQLHKKTLDSLHTSNEYILLKDKLHNYRKKSNNYSGTVLFGDILHSNFKTFNNNITQTGFSKLNEIGYRIGFGVSTKSDRAIFDFYFLTAGFNNRARRGDEKIRASLSNAFQFDIGIDLLKSNLISIYPFAGMSLRMSSLSYSKPVTTNSGYTNISDIIVNNSSVFSSSYRLGYQFGMGLDITLKTDREKEKKTILFAKFGANKPFWKDKYKIEGVKYAPGFKQGDWLVTVGIKFGKLR